MKRFSILCFLLLSSFLFSFYPSPAFADSSFDVRVTDISLSSFEHSIGLGINETTIDYSVSVEYHNKLSERSLIVSTDSEVEC
ncbi:MAG: hypothetical protein ACTSYA_10225 [Candidatus Kariarchaeaceae archaeon]